ncbi:MAG: hypothetical protein FWE06_02010 [Oscillospiraceae bacterium]|nr:hypothetical protein [Oscillospiraceae bacterium]
MLQVTQSNVMNFPNAIRGARNPMNSWAKSDSYETPDGGYFLGPNDLNLASRLCRAGSDHRKFMRQIFVSVDILAPLYWWKEFDTYKVGTVANSTSTMHKMHSKPFSISDFSYDQLITESSTMMQEIVEHLETLRLRYLDGRDKQIWYTMIQLLPSSYNQLRTVTLNYENLVSMHNQRRNHKLAEWHVFCDWIESLPYANELILMKASTSDEPNNH